MSHGEAVGLGFGEVCGDVGDINHTGDWYGNGYGGVPVMTSSMKRGGGGKSKRSQKESLGRARER